MGRWQGRRHLWSAQVAESACNKDFQPSPAPGLSWDKTEMRLCRDKCQLAWQPHLQSAPLHACVMIRRLDAKIRGFRLQAEVVAGHPWLPPHTFSWLPPHALLASPLGEEDLCRDSLRGSSV